MSLDVYLELRSAEVCPHCEKPLGEPVTREVFSANITHNLGRMADAAGVYQACWRPEEIGAVYAKQLTPLLRDGIARLRADPDHFRQFDAANGWGTYRDFVPWLERYLAACEEYPAAKVSVSR